MTAPVRFTPAGGVPTSKPYKGAFYKATDNYGFIYLGSLQQTIWRIQVYANGSTGPWEVAHGYPQGENDRGDMFVIDDQLFVIRGSKVYQTTIDQTTGALSAWSDAPPDLDEVQVHITWNATEPEPASFGFIDDYVCVTGSTRAFCARITRGELGQHLYLPLIQDHY